MELNGLNEPYYVEVSGEQNGQFAELVDFGFLAAGQSKSLNVVLVPPLSVDVTLNPNATIVEGANAQLRFNVMPANLSLRFEYDWNKDGTTDATNTTGIIDHIFTHYGVGDMSVRVGYGTGAVVKSFNVDIVKALSNPRRNLDVDDDLFIAPIDALKIINDLNSAGPRQLPLPGSPNAPARYLDVNYDGFVAPIDALVVINELNRNGAHRAEGEAAPPFAGETHGLAFESFQFPVLRRATKPPAITVDEAKKLFRPGEPLLIVDRVVNGILTDNNNSSSPRRTEKLEQSWGRLESILDELMDASTMECRGD